MSPTTNYKTLKSMITVEPQGLLLLCKVAYQEISNCAGRHLTVCILSYLGIFTQVLPLIRIPLAGIFPNIFRSLGHQFLWDTNPCSVLLECLLLSLPQNKSQSHHSCLLFSFSIRPWAY